MTRINRRYFRQHITTFKIESDPIKILTFLLEYQLVTTYRFNYESKRIELVHFVEQIFNSLILSFQPIDGSIIGLVLSITRDDSSRILDSVAIFLGKCQGEWKPVSFMSATIFYQSFLEANEKWKLSGKLTIEFSN